MGCCGVAVALGVGVSCGDPGIGFFVDGDVGVDESGFEGLGEQGDGVGGDLDGAVDVLPFAAVDGELSGEGGGQGMSYQPSWV